MKAKILIVALMAMTLGAQAQQPVAGTTYYLPKTALRFSLLIEKTLYTPGQFAMYADRYMKMNNVKLEPSTTYRLINVSMTPYGVPDSAKQFTLVLDKKLTVTEVDRDESGILLALNTQGKRVQKPVAFKSSRHPVPLDPRDYMNEDILSAGSVAKMAELSAQEIYDIRDSRAQLSRGQAEFMPKDGAQLRIMMDNLDKQERAMLQVFEGTTVKDTIESVFTFVPKEETERQLLFRFSKKLGLVDADDLSGEPYYVSVACENNVPKNAEPTDEKIKDDFGMRVNIPDKIHVTLTKDGETVGKYDVMAGQFGKVEALSGELFGKKQTSKVILNPISGSIEKIESETLK